MLDRQGLITFGGQEVTVVGADITIGHQAPEFSAHPRDRRTIHVLEETAGKVRVIAALPSIDTPMCDLEGQKFNEAAKAALDA